MVLSSVSFLYTFKLGDVCTGGCLYGCKAIKNSVYTRDINQYDSVSSMQLCADVVREASCGLGSVTQLRGGLWVQGLYSCSGCPSVHLSTWSSLAPAATIWRQFCLPHLTFFTDSKTYIKINKWQILFIVLRSQNIHWSTLRALSSRSSLSSDWHLALLRPYSLWLPTTPASVFWFLKVRPKVAPWQSWPAVYSLHR